MSLQDGRALRCAGGQLGHNEGSTQIDGHRLGQAGDGYFNLNKTPIPARRGR